MEPRIQYARTKDGVSIAYWTLGEGIPLVALPSPPISHLQLEWQWPEARRWFERLGQTRRLIRYDNRGSGLSDRNATDFSLEVLTLDLDAVVGALAIDRFVLWAWADAGPLAIAYAARHPERVSHLLLWGTWATQADFVSSSQYRAELALREALLDLDKEDWETYTETYAALVFGSSAGEEVKLAATYIRECVTPRVLRAAHGAMPEWRVESLLPQVSAPTLVLHRRQHRYISVEGARRIAAGIPNARFVLLEGTSVMPWGEEDTEVVANTIDEFLGAREDVVAAPELPEGMAVLLFADIAESTALTEQLGDAAFRAKARELDTSLRSVIRESGGTPVEGKVLGDGVLAVFTSARQAIDCALRCEAAGEPLGLRLHLGIHAGDVIREGNNVYGGAVNIAARIAAASEPGEVLVSDTVRSLGRTSADVTFDDRGEHELKGVGEPQRLFAVRGGG